MSDPTSIIIHGQSQAQRAPERGDISLYISSTGTNAVLVSETVQRTLLQVRQEIESLAAQDNPSLAASSSTPDDETTPSSTATICGPTRKVTKFNITAVSSRSWIPHPQQLNMAPNPFTASSSFNTSTSPLKNHESSVNLSVRFGDFAALGAFAIAMGQRDNVQVQNVRWSLTPSTQRELRAEAIRNAYGDALEKARAFAVAMGRDADAVRAKEITSKGDGMQGGFSFYGGFGGVYGQRQQVMQQQQQQAQRGEDDASPMPKEVVYEVQCEVKFESH